jgi:EmrB/QacA subfamily drug resistance transporter
MGSVMPSALPSDREESTIRPPLALAILVTAIPLFMATLDNLVVVFALPVIKARLGGSAETMQWVVNAYELAYAALLLTAAALGDRFGRRRLFAIGIALFTAASIMSALASSTDVLIAARVLQGAGGAAIVPLSLTLLSAAVPPNLRDVAIGIWGAVSGVGVAIGPLVSGAVVQGLAWQWIFWLNVPLGVLVLPLMWTTLRESRGPDRSLDPLGLLLSAAGVFALIWAIIHSDSHGWGSAQTLGVLSGGLALLVLFVLWQARARTPLMPLRLFRHRAFSVINVGGITFSFGVFGSVFLMAQYFQVVQGLSPLASGVRALPWTMFPMITAPLAGLLMGRLGARLIVTTGLALQVVAIGWIAGVTGVHVPYSTFVPAMLLGGAGLGMSLAPMSTVVLSSTPKADHGKASGVNNTVRELGVALGIAVLAAVLAARGGYGSGEQFVNGLRPALWVGAAVVAVGALLGLLLPGPTRAQPQPADETALAAEQAADPAVS